MRRRPLAPLALALAAASLPLAGVAGCFDHQCEGDAAGPYGEAFGEGHYVTADTWESSPIDARWMDFPPGRTWSFHLPAWDKAGRRVTFTTTYVSSADTPNAPHCCGEFDNFTEAAGNLAELSNVGAGRFQIKNATCTQLYLRVVARAAAPLDASAADAGAADVGVADASAGDADSSARDGQTE